MLGFLKKLDLVSSISTVGCAAWGQTVNPSVFFFFHSKIFSKQLVFSEHIE